MKPSLEALARIAEEVAAEAAQLAFAAWRGRLDVTKKGRTDLVTHVDLANEELIRERLAARTPDIPVVGEERGGSASAGLVWYADPIDGTTNYAHGHPIWCVSVGLVEDGEPVAGAVVAPVIQARWVGWRGGPALRNGEPVTVSDVDDVTEAYVGTGFPYAGREQEPESNFESFVRVKRVVQAVRRIGSAAIDCCFVAEGTYDGYWERAINPWDIAAGVTIVRAAGGRVSHLDGRPASILDGNLLVTNGHVHEALRGLIV